jgi:plastocyanin
MKKHIISKIRLTAFATIIPLLLFVAGCSKAEPVVVVNKSYTVEINQMKFTPDNLEVNKGDTVVWVNKDYVQHDVTDKVNKEWTSGPMNKDSKWSKVITKDEDYYCSIHVVMEGKIRVKE